MEKIYSMEAEREENYNSILEALSCQRVINIEKINHNRFRFIDACDDYFETHLTKDQVKKFIEELQELIK